LHGTTTDGSASLRYTPLEASDRGAKNDFDHESVRAGRRQPADHLQLAVVREDRIHTDSRRVSPHLRGYALARSEPDRSAVRDHLESGRDHDYPGLGSVGSAITPSTWLGVPQARVEGQAD